MKKRAHYRDIPCWFDEENDNLPNFVFKGDEVMCIKTWRGEGDYIWGGTAAYKRGEKCEVIDVLYYSDSSSAICIKANGYTGFDYVYTNKEPFFSEYFRPLEEGE